MTVNEIERVLRDLRLSGIAATLNTRVLQAQSSQQPFLETLAAMLQDELDRRHSRLIERRFKHSRLEERLTLGDFDWRFNPKLPRQACFELHTLKFIGEGANALIIGKPGTGKSHVAKAVAYQATLQGHDVRYVEADTEFASFSLCNSAEQARLLSDFIEPDLLVLDDLFLARRIFRRQRRAAADDCAPALQAPQQHHRHHQPHRPGLGQIPGRRHHGHHHPRSPHAPRRHARVRGQELQIKGGRRPHRCQHRERLINNSTVLPGGV